MVGCGFTMLMPCLPTFSRLNVDENMPEYVRLLSCQPRVTVTSCFVFKVISDLESIYHLCINPIRVSSSGMHKLLFNLTIVNKI